MNLKSLCCVLFALLLSACGTVLTATESPLPDLAIQGVHVSDVDENNHCLDTLVILATLVNRGNAPAYNVTLVEISTNTATQAQVLGVNEKFVAYFPVAPGGMYNVVADPENSILESDETNNSLSYVAPTPTPSVPCVPTSPVNPTPIPPPSDLSLNGLIFADLTANYLTRIVPGGFQPLLQGTDAVFSPDGRFAVFESGGDLLLAEPMDNPRINLTNTPDLIEQFPQWWASNPPKVVFSSISVDEMQQRVNASSPTITGHLTLMNTDGTDYAILSETPSYTMPALSPNGKTIAFEAVGSPRLYEIGKGILPFDPDQYGHPFGPFENEYYFSPSFSPDGHQLTWWVRQYEPASNNFALVMFDLVGMTSKTLHSYTALGGTLGWLPNPVWSPSGQWIAFQTGGEATPNDLWIMHQAGGIGQRLGLASNPVWSPDSQRLAFVQEPESANQRSVISIVEVPSWVVEPTSLPAASIPLAWIPPLESGAMQPFPLYAIASP
jgi:Tol biopolymer transport system component